MSPLRLCMAYVSTSSAEEHRPDSWQLLLQKLGNLIRYTEYTFVDRPSHIPPLKSDDPRQRIRHCSSRQETDSGSYESHGLDLVPAWQRVIIIINLHTQLSTVTDVSLPTASENRSQYDENTDSDVTRLFIISILTDFLFGPILLICIIACLFTGRGRNHGAPRVSRWLCREQPNHYERRSRHNQRQYYFIPRHSQSQPRLE